MTYCDTCGALASHSVMDSEEIEAPAGEWREFRETTKRSGCSLHRAVAVCVYRDGRIIEVDKCKPERVPLALPAPTS